MNHKIDMEKREEMIKRTVYVSDIDQLVLNLAFIWILWFGSIQWLPRVFTRGLNYVLL